MKYLVFFFLVFKLAGQGVVMVNYDIDTTIFRVEEPLKLWLHFLQTRDDSAGAKYWNSAEVRKFGDTSYFLLEKELSFGNNNFLEFLGKYARIKVLNIKKIDKYFKITSLLEFKSNKEDVSYVQYIFHVYAGEEEGKLKLFNPLKINTRLYCNSTKVGYVKYHYPKGYSFNFELAEKQSKYLEELCEHFGVKAESVDFYFAPTNEEILRLRGFDFLIGNSGEEIPSGRADVKNKIAYASGVAEYYPHELIHILITSHFIPTCHPWFNEGIATYFGQSRGKPLEWHLKKLNAHLQAHPEINLNDMLKLINLDQYTDYRYVLGGYLVKKAFEKGGYELLKKLLNAGKTEEDFYKAIENYLDIKRQDLNSFIRQDLQK